MSEHCSPAHWGTQGNSGALQALWFVAVEITIIFRSTVPKVLAAGAPNLLVCRAVDGLVLINNKLQGMWQGCGGSSELRWPPEPGPSPSVNLRLTLL